MTVTIDASSEVGFAANVTSITGSAGVAFATDTAGLVFFEWNGTSLPAGLSVTWNSVAMTQVGTTVTTSGGTQGNQAAALFGIVNPTGANASVVKATWTTASQSGYFAAFAYQGSSTASVASAFPNFVSNTSGAGTSTSLSITINSASTNLPAICGGTGLNSLTAGSITTTGGTYTSEYVDGNEVNNVTGGRSSVTGSSIVATITTSPADQMYIMGCDVAVPSVSNPILNIDTKSARRLPTSITDLSQSLNPNLFKNPIPFNQFDYNKPMRVPQAPFDLSVPLNPNLFTNPVPIFNGDQSSSRSIRWLPYPQDGININLFTNPYPFNQYDWSKSVRTLQSLPYPRDGINPNLFTNPFPIFNGDQSSSRSIRWLPYPQDGTNPNIFTNPYPILNIDTPLAQPIRGRPLVDAPYNQTLYSVTVVANPFYAAEVFLVKRLKSAPLQEQTFNPNLFTNPFPFNQYDWSKPVNVPQARLEPNQTLNINIFTNPLPFSQYDWSKPVRTPQAPFSPDQALNINLFTNPFPNNQYDWSKPVTVPRAPVFPHETLNINLFTNPVPVLNIDTPTAKPIKGGPWPDSPYNQNIYSIVVVAAPFVQTDWTPVRKPPTTTAPEQVFNPNLFANPVPFNQFDYPQTRRVPTAPFDLSTPTNLQLFTNPVPFYNVDYTPPKKPWPTAPDRSPGFQITLSPTAAGIPSLAFSLDLLVYSSAALEAAAYQALAFERNVVTVLASDSPSGQNWSGAGYMANYEIDTAIQINGEFRNSLTGVYIDPTAITLFVIDPSAATTSYTFPGTITRDSLGHFHQQITPAKSGVWTYKWQATGSVVATSPDTSFTVNASALIAG